jgi:hypothetical protein
MSPLTLTRFRRREAKRLREAINAGHLEPWESNLLRVRLWELEVPHPWSEERKALARMYRRRAAA